MIEIKRELRAGQIYKHFKGKLYQIITVAVHSESGEELVIYQELYDNFKSYARPINMFMSEVDQKKYPDIEQTYRFELVLEPVWSTGISQKPFEPIQTTSAEQKVNPYLIKFLDADTYEDRKNILVSIRNHMTDRLIDDIAASLDITVDDGDLDVRYSSLMNCIEARKKFESNRLR